MIGKRLLHYDIRDQLGKGGMGEVYLAHDTKLGRDVAVKILPAEVADDADRRSRFMREARAVAALKHPNIVTIHAVEESGGVLFIVMELVEGQAFSELIPRRGFGVDQLFSYASPLADAMAAAHDKGITHRDLKPANMMLDEGGRLKVLDFGLAKLLAPNVGEEDAETVVRTSDTAAGMVLGTAAYMSPEQAEGKPIDHRSDIFSMGIVLYEMSTGERPFKGDTRISTTSSILKDEPPKVTHLNQSIPHHFGRVIHRCLEKDPDRRYQSAKDVRNELEGLKKEIESGELTESSVITAYPSGAGAAAGSFAGPAGHTPAPATSSPPPASDPSAVSDPGTTRSRSVKTIGLVVIVAIVAVAGVFIVRSLGPGSSTTTGATDSPTPASTAPATAPADSRKAAVVLPFENLGPPEDAYFAAGVTEEITTRLAKVSELRVISRTSAVNYDRSGKTMREIGQDLGVQYVIEGSVRWAKTADGTGRVRISTQLIHVADDSHLWSDTYDREVTDIFEVQTDIANRVIDALGVTLLGKEKELIAEKPTDNIEAYELYLKEKDYQPGQETFEEVDRKTVAMYERATELDPNFVSAWYRLARHHSDLYRVFDKNEARLSRAKAAVEGAAAADPDHFETHLARGYYHYYGFRDYDLALEEFLAATELVPGDSDALAATGYIYRRQGKFQESIKAHEAALELDPRNDEVALNVAVTYGALRDFDNALRAFDRALAVKPDDPDYLGGKAATVILATGDLDDAERILEPAAEVGGPSYIFQSYFIRRLRRDYSGAIDVLSKLPESSESGSIIHGFKHVLLGLTRILNNDSKGGRESLETGVTALEEAITASPGNWQVRQFLSAGYAALGRDEEAIREAKAAVDLAAKDLYGGGQALQTLATIYAKLGRHEEAIDLVERLMRKSYASAITIHMLRLDPVWDPLREHPRFQAIVNAPSEL